MSKPPSGTSKHQHSRERRVLRQVLFTLLGIGAIAYGLICVALYSRQTRFLFFPERELDFTPADFGMPYTEVWLPIQPEDRDRPIHGWWIPSEDSDRVLLYLHGNGSNISSNIAHAERFYRLGVSVLLIDYRGYGKSKGEFPNERRVYQDAHAAWNYLVHEQQISPQQIVIYGHSMGGAIAIELAMRQPDAAGLIVQSSFSSIRAMADYVRRFRLFPLDLILTERFDSLAKVPRLSVPVLFIHGANDWEVPALMSQQLYEAAPEPKELWLVPQAGHNNVGEIAGDEFRHVVRKFVERLP